jgi:hypothetical protein
MRFAEEQVLTAPLGLRGSPRIQLAIDDAQLGRRWKVQQFLELRHHVHLAPALQNVHAFLLGNDRVAVEISGTLFELREVLHRLQRPLRTEEGLNIHATDEE